VDSVKRKRSLASEGVWALSIRAINFVVRISPEKVLSRFLAVAPGANFG